jgi:RimJ/RimL family protein N-acetyltransferase
MRLREVRKISEAEQIRIWFLDDAEGNRRLSSYANPDDWFKLLGPSRHVSLVVSEDQSLGFVDMELEGSTGYFAYYVAPNFRGRGYGVEVLRLTIAQARALGLTVLKGGVEPDNAASVATLKRVGFDLLPEDGEGMLPTRLVLDPAQS